MEIWVAMLALSASAIDIENARIVALYATETDCLAAVVDELYPALRANPELGEYIFCTSTGRMNDE